MNSPNHSVSNEFPSFEEISLPYWPISSIKQSILQKYFENGSDLEYCDFEIVKICNDRLDFKFVLQTNSSQFFHLKTYFQVILGIGDGNLLCKTQNSVNQVPIKQLCHIKKPFELINQGKQCKIGIQVSM